MSRPHLWLTSRFLVGGVSTAVASLVLLERLKPEAWAAFTTALLVMQAVSEILLRGFSASIIKLNEEPSRAYRAIVVRRQLLVSAALSVGAMGLGLSLSAVYGTRTFLILLCATVPTQFAFAFRSVAVACLERRQDFRRVAIIEASESVGFALVCVVATSLTTGLGALALPFLLDGGLSLLLVRFVASDLLVWPSKERGVPDLAFGQRLIVISLLGLTIGLAPQTLLAESGDANALAHVQLALVASTYALTLVQVLLRIGFVRFAQSDRRSAVNAATARIRELVPFTSAFLIGLAALTQALIRSDLMSGKIAAGLQLVTFLVPGYMLIAGLWTVLAPLASSQGGERILVVSLMAAYTGYLVAGFVLLHVTDISREAALCVAFDVSATAQILTLVVLVTRRMGATELGAPFCWLFVMGLAAPFMSALTFGLDAAIAILCLTLLIFLAGRQLRGVAITSAPITDH